MRNFAAYLLLLYPLILFACLKDGQSNISYENYENKKYKILVLSQTQ